MNHVIPRWQSTRNRALIDAVYAVTLTESLCGAAHPMNGGFHCLWRTGELSSGSRIGRTGRGIGSPSRDRDG